MPEVKTNKHGTQFWVNDKGQLSREDGPAVIFLNGYKEWWLDGELHRIDGPAVESGPYQEWWTKGIRNRLDGPAVIWTDGTQFWYIDGEEFTEEEYNKKLKM